MISGTTFTHRQANWLDLDSDKVFEDLLSCDFDIIRLGCYWSDIEKEKGTYDFAEIVKLLALCERKGQKVLLTVGMKAPRWPEFYFPEWISQKDPEQVETEVLAFIQKGIDKLSRFSCIRYWQVENEPLDPSGPSNLKISEELLKKEVALVRSLDSRPIVVTVWGNALTKRNSFTIAETLADIVGIDLYYKTPFWKSFYKGPWDNDRAIAQVITKCSKPVWITELQAEPWERHGKEFTSSTPESITVALLEKNIERADRLEPEALFLWGYEYWMYRRNVGDTGYLDVVKKRLKRSKAGDQRVSDQMS